MADDSSPGPGRGATAAMTALAAAYPAVATVYFWEDWLRFFKLGAPMALRPEGLLIDATETMGTFLSPWRVLAASATAVLLAVCAKRMWQRRPDASALSLVVLGGVLLPQVFWYGELSLDWFRGRGLALGLAACVAAVAVPMALVLRKRGAGLAEWGLARGPGRVVAAAVGLGWIGLGATAMLEHIYQFADAGLAVAAALATLPLVGLGMVGLVRKRTWGLVAGAGAVFTHLLLVLGLSGASYGPSGRAMDVVTAATADSPALAAIIALVPAAIFAVLLAPFLSGLLRGAAGRAAAPLAVEAVAVEPGASTQLRIATPPVHDEERALDDDLAEEESELGAPRARMQRARG